MLRLTSLRSGHLYCQELFVLLISVRGWVNDNGHLGNRTRDLPDLGQYDNQMRRSVPRKRRYTFSVKLSDCTVWRRTWRKNWVNSAVFTGNSAGLGTVLSRRLSHRELRSLLRESQIFVSLPADTPMASSQGTHFIQQISITWYIPFQMPLLTPHFTISFLIFG